MVSRRAFLGTAAGAAIAAGFPPMLQAAAVTSGLYIWAVNPADFIVPSAVWTRVPFGKVAFNTTGAHLDTDGATWIFPTATAHGNWAMVCNIAWDMPTDPTIAVPHRRLIRFVQQGVGTGQFACPIAETELTFLPELALLDAGGKFADGTNNFQQGQVYVQTGVKTTGVDQRIWLEVYQNSGHPQICRWDGSLVPKTPTRPYTIMAWQAPSFMVAKLCDL